MKCFFCASLVYTISFCRCSVFCILDSLIDDDIVKNILWEQAGEERFSIELDENDQVWYEVLSFSKPAHFLSFIGYPYVQLRQKYFAHQSANAVLKNV